MNNRISGKRFKHTYSAFTMAELLIALAIIGVVAALTVPSVVKKYEKLVLTSQLKTNYSSLASGYRKMIMLEHVGNLEQIFSKYCPNFRQYVLVDNVACVNEVNNKVLAKYFSISKLGEYEVVNGGGTHYHTYRHLYNNQFERTSSYTSYLLNNGALLFSGWNSYDNIYSCVSPLGLSSYYPCAITIDVNGEKRPNIYGRDVFSFKVNADGSIEGINGREYFGEDNIGSKRIMEDGWEMKY